MASVTSPVVGSNGIIYIAGERDVFYALRADGSKLWQQQMEAGTDHIGIPSIGHDGTVYFTYSHSLGVVFEEGKPSEPGARTVLAALEPLTGKVKWTRGIVTEPAIRVFFEHWASQVIAASDGTVYVAAAGLLNAYASSGKMLWSYKFPENSSRMASAPSLSPDEKTIYVYDRRGGGLYAFDTRGKVKWHDKTPYHTDGSSPSVGKDGTIYVMDYTSAGLHAIDPQGKKKWVGSFAGKNMILAFVAAGVDGMIYAAVDDKEEGSGGAIYALNGKDGSVVWKFGVDKGNVAGIITIDGRGNLYYAAGNGTVYCLDRNGKLVWEYPMDVDQSYYASPVISDGTLYLLTLDSGILFAIGDAGVEGQAQPQGK